MGQIRTNQFVESPWELREFRTDASSGSVLLVPDTIKGNPVTEGSTMTTRHFPLQTLDSEALS